MKTKVERQEQLDMFGLNVPRYTQINILNELKSISLAKELSWSIRSMPQKEFTLGERAELFSALEALIPEEHKHRLNPNFPPNIFALPNEWCFAILKCLLERGLIPIICAGIDMTKCLFAGAALKHKDGSMIIEIAEGAVNVRRVTQEGLIDRRFTYFCNINWFYREGKGHPDDGKVRQVAIQLRNVPLEDVIFEFSYYSVPVGHKQEHIIFWDYLPAGKYLTK